MLRVNGQGPQPQPTTPVTALASGADWMLWPFFLIFGLPPLRPLVRVCLLSLPLASRTFDAFPKAIVHFVIWGKKTGVGTLINPPDLDVRLYTSN